MRWFVGDLQGCVKELELLLKEIHFNPGRDELVCLGDLIRRGPDSLATLRLWQDIGGTGVIGNHEIHELHIADGLREPNDEAVACILDAQDGDALMEAIRGLPVVRRFDAVDGGLPIIAVHAGLHPRWVDLDETIQMFDDIQKEAHWYQHPSVSFATQVRCCTEAGERSRFTGEPDAAPAPFVPWDCFYRGQSFVVHGHWARRGYYRQTKTMGLDSGCVYGGMLSAWCQEEDVVVHIPSLQPSIRLQEGDKNH